MTAAAKSRVTSNVSGAAIVWGVNCPYGRHNEMANVAFCDGHAKSMKPLTLYANGVDTYYNP